MLEAHDYLELYTWILIHYWRCVVEASRVWGLNDRRKVLNLISDVTDERSLPQLCRMLVKQERSHVN
jgi:hypothetical protein